MTKHDEDCIYKTCPGCKTEYFIYDNMFELYTQYRKFIERLADEEIGLEDIGDKARGILRDE